MQHSGDVQWVWPLTSTSAVGLLGGGLALTEADSGPLGAGEILRQGNIEDLVVQRITVCRGTQKQTHLTLYFLSEWQSVYDEQDMTLLPCSPAVCVGLRPSSPLGWKPPLAQSSMGLTWSSGLSDSQGGNFFSARILAICERERRHKETWHSVSKHYYKR